MNPFNYNETLDMQLQQYVLNILVEKMSLTSKKKTLNEFEKIYRKLD